MEDMRGCGCDPLALITRGGRGAAWTGARSTARERRSAGDGVSWRGRWRGLRAAAGACVASGQAGLETGPRGGRAHPSPPRGTPVLGGRPAGSAGLPGGFCPHPCSAGGREGGRPVQGGTEGPHAGARLSCQDRGPRFSATVLAWGCPAAS